MLAPERYKGLQSGTHFELSLEDGYPVLGAGVGGHFRRTDRDWWAFGRAGGFGEGGKIILTSIHDYWKNHSFDLY